MVGLECNGTVLRPKQTQYADSYGLKYLGNIEETIEVCENLVSFNS